MPIVRSTLIAIAAGCLIALSAHPADADPPWQPSPWFDEFSFTASFEPAGRIHVNAPARAGKPARATRLIVYALPNGNTLEQTLGCRMREGLDWHYDIQHVAAQVRLLRTLVPDERIVLVCAEAGGLSWPHWRRTHAGANQHIARLLNEWRAQLAAPGCKVFLTGHSGGGSFLFGVIEATDKVPGYIDRIGFLDANYSFEADRHAKKLAGWLTRDDSHHLLLLAYDDREIMLDGKKVVGPTSGTYRATGRMRDAFGQELDLTESQNKPFRETTALDGRLHFYVHQNPQNKILHTALIGEMNGLVHVATLGTAQQNEWGTFGGPRAYTKWVQPEPTPKDNQPAEKPADKEEFAVPPSQSRLPPRPADALGGKAFIQRIGRIDLDAREAAIYDEITRGNFPQFLRDFRRVPLSDSPAAAATMEVMPDYLSVGDDRDFVRIPMTPQTAQRIAHVFGCTLPTRKIVDAIDARAELHLPPHPLTQDREAVRTFLAHHQIIEDQRAGKPLGLLLCGIKKDIVLTPRIFERPQRLAIYGWRKLDGQPIQPLTIAHSSRYVDYSHGVRLVRNAMLVNGRQEKITDLLANPARASLVSDDGPMNPPRYPLRN